MIYLVLYQRINCLNLWFQKAKTSSQKVHRNYKLQQRLLLTNRRMNEKYNKKKEVNLI